MYKRQLNSLQYIDDLRLELKSILLKLINGKQVSKPDVKIDIRYHLILKQVKSLQEQFIVQGLNTKQVTNLDSFLIEARQELSKKDYVNARGILADMNYVIRRLRVYLCTKEKEPRYKSIVRRLNNNN